MSITDQIPGLKEAIEEEQHVRDTSFLDIPERIACFDVNPITLSHILALGSVGSPFIRGGIPSPVDAAAFLCVVGDWRGFKRWVMLRQVKRTDFLSLVMAIDDYMKESFQDSPATSGDGGVSYYSFAASIVDCFAKEYGWNERDILRIPVKRLFQYVKAIARRNGETMLFNPSDKVRGDWLRMVNSN